MMPKAIALRIEERERRILRVDQRILGSHLENERSRVEALFDKIRDVTSGLQMQGAVHASGIDDFKKRWEESDRRRWTIFGVMLAAILTFAANLILLFMRK